MGRPIPGLAKPAVSPSGRAVVQPARPPTFPPAHPVGRPPSWLHDRQLPNSRIVRGAGPLGGEGARPWQTRCHHVKGGIGRMAPWTDRSASGVAADGPAGGSYRGSRARGHPYQRERRKATSGP